MTVPLMKTVSRQNEALANRIGSLIIRVYNDTKTLSMSAFSWPSRITASKISSRFRLNEPFMQYEPAGFDLQ
jgi:hypothetical protein